MVAVDSLCFDEMKITFVVVLLNPTEFVVKREVGEEGGSEFNGHLLHHMVQVWQKLGSFFTTRFARAHARSAESKGKIN